MNDALSYFGFEKYYKDSVYKPENARAPEAHRFFNIKWEALLGKYSNFLKIVIYTHVGGVRFHTFARYARQSIYGDMSHQ